MDNTVDELKILITAQTKKFEQKMKEITQQIQGLDKEAAKSVDSLGDRFKNLGNKVASAAKAITASVAAIGAAMVGVTESTRQFREDLARLQATALTTGRDFGQVKEQFMRIYEISGEVDSSVEAMNNLMAAGFQGGALEQIVNELNGAAIAFSDTLKIEGLADGLQETLATGKSIGPFDELLSRLGVNLDRFNAGLQQAIKNGTAHNYVLNTLASSGLSNVNTAYRQMNSELIKGRQVRMELQMALGDLAKAVEPIVNAVIPYITKFIQLITKAINYTVIFVKTLFGKDSAANVVESQNKAVEQLNKSTAAVNKNAATGANKTKEMSGNLGDASKEAKKLQKTLAGFDEINTLNFNNDTNASNADTKMDPIGIDIAPFEMPDISPFEEQIAKIPDAWMDAMERIRTTLKNIFEPWADAIKKYSPDILGSFKELGKGIAGVFSALGNALEGIFAHVGYRQFVDGFVGFTANAFGLLVDALNGTVLPMLQGFFKAFDPDINPYMDKFMFTLGEVAQKSKESAGAIRRAFEPVFEMLAPKFHDLGYAIGTVFVSALDLAVFAWGSFMDALNPENNYVMKSFINVFGVALAAVTDMVTAIANHVAPIFEKLKPVVDRVVTSLTNLYLIIGESVLKVLTVFFDKLNPDKNPAMAILIARIGDLMEKFLELWAIVAEKLAPVIEKLTPLFMKIASVISDFLITALDTFIELFDGVINAVSGVLTGDWERIWEGALDVVKNFWVLFLIPVGAAVAAFRLALLPIVKTVETVAKLASKSWKAGLKLTEPVRENIKKIQEMYEKLADEPKTKKEEKEQPRRQTAWSNLFNFSEPVKNETKEIEKELDKVRRDAGIKSKKAVREFEKNFKMLSLAVREGVLQANREMDKLRTPEIKNVKTANQKSQDSKKISSNTGTSDLSNVTVQAGVAGKNATGAFTKAFQIAAAVKNEVLKAKAELDKFIAHAGIVGKKASDAFNKSFSMSAAVKNEVLKTKKEVEYFGTYAGNSARNASAAFSKGFNMSSSVKNEIEKTRLELSKVSAHAATSARNASNAFNKNFKASARVKEEIVKSSRELSKIENYAKSAGAKSTAGFKAKFDLKKAVSAAAKLGLSALNLFSGGIGGLAVQATIAFAQKFKLADKVRDAVSKCKPYLDKIKNWFNDTKEAIGNWFSGGSSSGKKTTARIPKMARGGIVSSAQHFIAGESGREVVMPLENNTQWLDIVANKLMQGMRANTPTNNSRSETLPPIVLQVDGKELAKVVGVNLNQLSKIEGRSILKLQF